ncbi:hypothetical protein GQ457_14G015140 [Hibiscus cannabinus]
MRIVLNQKRKEYVIKEHVPNEPGTNTFRANIHKFKKHMNDILDVRCLMLATMTPELQKQLEYMVAYEMIQNLKEILKGQHDCRGMRPLRIYFHCKMNWLLMSSYNRCWITSSNSS